MAIAAGIISIATQSFASPPALPPVPTLPPLTPPLTTLPPKFNTSPSLRLPAILALGLGGLGAGGAVVTGLAAQAQTRYDISNCGSQCGGGRAPSDNALSITSTVLSIVAAAGVTTGLILLLTESNRSEKKSIVPRLGLKLSPQKAAASATWKF